MVSVRKKTASALIFCFSFHRVTAKPKVYTVIINKTTTVSIVKPIPPTLQVFLFVYHNQ
jgi:hypothetical protein